MTREAPKRLLLAGVGATVLAAVLAHVAAQGAPAGDADEGLHKDLMAAMDVFERGGRWKEADSALLGWSCGQQLQALVCLYEATGERPWLDRLFKYAETMFANLTPNRDGFLSWRSRGYSPAYAQVRPGAANRSTAAMEPGEQWIADAAVARQVRDAEFRLVAREDPALKVECVTGEETPPVILYEPGKPFDGPFGVRLTLDAAPAPGDTFALITRRPKDFDFAVHDGMVLMPISRAVELVKKDRALRDVYGERADRLLRVIETQLVSKWAPYWRETGDGGCLGFPADPAFDPSGATMPHNQYLPLGTVQVTLYRITGKPIYRERAAKMARFFKSCLRLVDDHYEWNYWDAAGEWDKQWDKPAEKRPEDTGHGSLDIGFVLACAENGIVFDDADLERFARTFLKVMWNGSLEAPAVGGYVNTARPTRQSGNLQHWLLLARADPRVREVCERLIPGQGSLWAKAQLYRLRAGRAKEGR